MVSIEADVSNGLPCFNMVGLLSSEVREAKERVRSAIKNSGFFIPSKRITLSLSPAYTKKEGSGFDLPIAISLLAAVGEIETKKIANCMFVGELSLNGNLKKTKGILLISKLAIKNKVKKIFIPKVNLNEVKLINGIEIIGVDSLNEVVLILKDKIKTPIKKNLEEDIFNDENILFDFKDIYGQDLVKRATQIAVAGMHNILYIGGPGSGKTMISKAISGILPKMSTEEMLEVTGIYSAMGSLSSSGVISKRPYRTVHHTTTTIALIGGGKNPKPGEITLAHKGVLFLDELPEFKREAVESLREPMEDKKIIINRKEGSFEFPSDFMFVGAMNPCPCGYYPDKSKCDCSPYEINRYLNKVKGALLDRIDICVETPKLKIEDLQSENKNESSKEIRKKIERVHDIQKNRYCKEKVEFNSSLSEGNIKKYCPLGKKELKTMEKIFNKMNISGRGYHKIIKVARTIADFEGEEDIKEEHLLEAFAYRSFVQ